MFVASTPDFTEQHLVANGASNLIVGVLGDKGKHARAAFGVAALPLGAAVEVEAIVEVEADAGHAPDCSTVRSRTGGCMTAPRA